jgi:cytochrome c peroxidase
MKKSSLLIAIPLLAAAAPSCKSAHGNSDVAIDTVPAGESHPGPQPDFGPLVRAPEPPPPITGGTLAVAPDGNTAVAADTDRDRVYIVDIPTRNVTHVVQLERHAEPGRVAIDDKGHAYVVLRRSGGVAVIDLATGGLEVRQACATPRGVAFDAKAQKMYVTCAAGEFVSMPLDGSAPSIRNLGKDLRDVVVLGDDVINVTRFRSAELLQLYGSSTGATNDPSLTGDNLAWRAVAMPDPTSCSDCKTTAVVSQAPTPAPVSPTPGGYGGASSSAIVAEGECAATGIVSTKLTIAGRGSVSLPEAVLPVDLATNGKILVVVAAGNAFTRELPQLFILGADDVSFASGNCVPATHGNVPGQAVAVAFDGTDELLVQTREPAALHIMTEDRRRPWKTIELASDSVQDTGHAIFHSNAGGFIACASCHAEGADDGHVWDFLGMGPRRTPSLLGTVEGTQPYHWDGDMTDLRMLVDHVFVERMSGPKIDDQHLETLKTFLFALPPPAKLREATDPAAQRGGDLFGQRCVTCHNGARLTNNQSVDVGTGGKFQVPSLVGVGWRAPYIHTGCATTLFDRFDPSCGGTGHAQTSDLTPDQIQDIVAYLETL